MIIAFTGNGKGKTTAAVGNAIRFIGGGKRAFMLQFIKGPWTSGEHETVLRLDPEFRIVKCGKGFVGILGDTLPFSEHQKAAVEGLALAKKEIDAGNCDLIILDEAHNAVALKLLTTAQLVEFITYAKDKVEHIITTGRDAPKAIIKMADLVTEMKEIKHPYQKGEKAKKGLDF